MTDNDIALGLLIIDDDISVRVAAAWVHTQDEDEICSLIDEKIERVEGTVAKLRRLQLIGDAGVSMPMMSLLAKRVRQFVKQ